MTTYRPVKGTGRVQMLKIDIPDAYVSLSPTQLFSGRRHCGSLQLMTFPTDQSMVVVLVSGACSNEGQLNPELEARAGCAFWHGIESSGEPSIKSHRLEMSGPFDANLRQQTFDRAELRAVIAALRFRHWPTVGLRALAIATSSDFVIDGATYWCNIWVGHGWRTVGDTEVPHRDLWEALLGEAALARDHGMAIFFQKLTWEQNDVVRREASMVARCQRAAYYWVDHQI